MEERVNIIIIFSGGRGFELFPGHRDICAPFDVLFPSLFAPCWY